MTNGVPDAGSKIAQKKRDSAKFERQKSNKEQNKNSKSKKGKQGLTKQSS